MRGMVEHGDFIEIYWDAPVEGYEDRDVKGVSRKPRAGLIAEFTGISSQYKVRKNLEHTVNASCVDLDECVRQDMVK
jgi:adenylylsulfate kinase